MLSSTRSLPLLDTEVVRTFVAIAESGSFTKAAQQLYRTPSALSMQIKRLEETLEQTLFVREARQVRLTREGEVLLGYGRRLLKLNEEAVSQFLVPSLEGEVRFGTPDDVGTRILPVLLRRFARVYPAVQVNVVVAPSTQLIKMLDNGERDCILVSAGNKGQDPLRGEVVHTEQLVWAGRDGGIACQTSPLPVALAGHGCQWRSMALNALYSANIPYRVAYTGDNIYGQEVIMEADLAISCLPISLVRKPLARLDEKAGLPPLGSYQTLLLKRDGIGPAAETLSGFVRETFDQLREESMPTIRPLS